MLILILILSEKSDVGEGGRQMNSSCPVSEYILLLEAIPEDVPQCLQWDVNQTSFSRLSKKALIIPLRAIFIILGVFFCFVNILKAIKNIFKVEV